MKRRTVLLGGLGGAIGAAALLRPSDIGADHTPYFSSLSDSLDAAEGAKPTLVIDKSRLLQNLDTLTAHLKDRFNYRIVAKSLPSLDLLELVMNASGSNRLMLFHQPFANLVASTMPHADVLMGKPMPVAAARQFYRTFTGGGFEPQKQLNWLVDSPARLQEYEALAREIGQTLRVCVELDVGLHRGGVSTDEQLRAMLEQFDNSSHIRFSGFMGYEPHIVKIPGGKPEEYRDQAVAVYKHYLAIAKAHLTQRWPKDAILNIGGSPTYQLYGTGDYPFTELAAGSCLVKPTDFDLPSLADHVPASYIATPVIKALPATQIPGIDLGGLQAMWDPNRERAFFTYGGYWKAKPESPQGLSTNSLYGRSTNQEMLNGSSSVNLQPDDWVFLRPTQSEFVFLQFGDIAVYDGGEIAQRWPVFSENGVTS